MGRNRKSGGDLIVLAVVALLVWVASRVKGTFRLIVTVVLVAGAILALTTPKRWMAGFVVIGVVFMWREKLPRGLYLRRALSVGPFRVNVSTSGLGGSVGVVGARIGRRPDGSKYVHAGRGGVYYRKELRGNSPQSEEEVGAPVLPSNDARVEDLGQSEEMPRGSPVPPGGLATTYTWPSRPQSPSGSSEPRSGLPSVDSGPESSEAAFYCDTCCESHLWGALVETRECPECDHRFDASGFGKSCPTCGHAETEKVTDLACPNCLEESAPEAGP